MKKLEESSFSVFAAVGETTFYDLLRHTLLINAKMVLAVLQVEVAFIGQMLPAQTINNFSLLLLM